MSFFKLKLGACSFLLMGMVNFENVVCAKVSYDKVSSPLIYSNYIQNLLNGKTNKTKLEEYVLGHQFDKNPESYDTISSTAFRGRLPIEFKNDEIFAVVIDKFKGPVEYVKCFKEEKEKEEEEKDESLGIFTVKFTFRLPYYTDLFSVHFYKQNKNDPQFLLRRENFIEKLQFSLTGRNICYIGAEYTNVLRSLDKYGNVIEGARRNFFKFVTPNFYKIDAGFSPSEEDLDLIGLIVLPEDKKHLLSFEERVTTDSGCYAMERQDPQHDSYIAQDSHVFSFYLPPEIDEFEFYVYKGEIKEENFQYKHHIKLERK